MCIAQYKYRYTWGPSCLWLCREAGSSGHGRRAPQRRTRCGACLYYIIRCMPKIVCLYVYTLYYYLSIIIILYFSFFIITYDSYYMCLIMLISVFSILYVCDFLYVVMGWWMLINVLKIGLYRLLC